LVNSSYVAYAYLFCNVASYIITGRIARQYLIFLNKSNFPFSLYIMGDMHCSRWNYAWKSAPQVGSSSPNFV